MLDSHTGMRGLNYQALLGTTIATVVTSLQKKPVTNRQIFNSLYDYSLPKVEKKGKCQYPALYLKLYINASTHAYVYTHTERTSTPHPIFRQKLTEEVLLTWMKPSHKQLIRSSCFLTCPTQRQVSLLFQPTSFQYFPLLL